MLNITLSFYWNGILSILNEFILWSKFNVSVSNDVYEVNIDTSFKKFK
jgi:hypothetical protein